MFTWEWAFFFFKSPTTAAAHFLSGISYTYLSKNDGFFNPWILTRRHHPWPQEAGLGWVLVLVNEWIDKGLTYFKQDWVTCAHISCSSSETHCSVICSGDLLPASWLKSKFWSQNLCYTLFTTFLWTMCDSVRVLSSSSLFSLALIFRCLLIQVSRLCTSWPCFLEYASRAGGIWMAMRTICAWFGFAYGWEGGKKKEKKERGKKKTHKALHEGSEDTTKE